MIAYVVICFLIYYAKAPWWLYIPIATGMIMEIINWLVGIYEAGKESK